MLGPQSSSSAGRHLRLDSSDSSGGWYRIDVEPGTVPDGMGSKAWIKLASPVDFSMGVPPAPRPPKFLQNSLKIGSGGFKGVPGRRGNILDFLKILEILDLLEFLEGGYYLR